MKRYKKLNIKKYISLYEKDNRNVIKNKILRVDSDYIPNDLHKLDSKYSIILANIFINYFIENSLRLASRKHNREIFKKWIDKKTLASEEEKIVIQSMNNDWNDIKRGGIINILDWLKGRNERPNPNEPVIQDLKKLSYTKALHYADEWHEYIKLSAKDVILETGKVVIKFNDGYYWVDLETNACEAEAKAGGHCGRSAYGSSGNLYSLRSPQHKMILTADVDKLTGNCNQIRGAGNTKPKEKYHKYIKEFLLNKKINIKSTSFENSWRPNDNFQLSDLSTTNFKEIWSKKPKIISGSFLMDMYKQGKMQDELMNYVMSQSFDDDNINLTELEDNDFKKVYKRHKDKMNIKEKFHAYQLGIEDKNIIKYFFERDNCKVTKEGELEITFNGIIEASEAFLDIEGQRIAKYIYENNSLWEDFWETGLSGWGDFSEALKYNLTDDGLKKLQEILPEFDYDDNYDELLDKYGEEALNIIENSVDRAVESGTKYDYYNYVDGVIKNAFEEHFTIKIYNIDEVVFNFDEIAELFEEWKDDPEYIAQESIEYLISEYLGGGISTRYDERYTPYVNDDKYFTENFFINLLEFNDVKKAYIDYLESFKDQETGKLFD